MWIRAKLPVHALVSGLESIRALRSDSKHGIMRQLCDDRRNEVQGIPALAVACGCTLLWIRAKLPVHAPCLDWSRFRRSRQEAHTASCPIFAKVDFGLPRAKFSSRVHLGIQASRIFRTTPRKKIWSHFVQSYFVRTLAYGTWLRSLVNVPCLDWSRFGRSRQKANTASPRACTVSGLESIRVIRSENKHGIM